ncbi:hypothetical protein TNCV_4694601 [Trichonephila clavipes]|nr:hypothetical protein TNCV_4694601 [Trichonephila clavipes]
MEHVGCDPQNWSKVMFSDEYYSNVTKDSGHILQQRERGTRYAQKSAEQPTRDGVAKMAKWQKPLYIFERGSVTSQQYWRESILDHVRIFGGSCVSRIFVYG